MSERKLDGLRRLRSGVVAAWRDETGSFDERQLVTMLWTWVVFVVWWLLISRVYGSSDAAGAAEPKLISELMMRVPLPAYLLGVGVWLFGLGRAVRMKYHRRRMIVTRDCGECEEAGDCRQGAVEGECLVRFEEELVQPSGGNYLGAVGVSLCAAGGVGWLVGVAGLGDAVIPTAIAVGVLGSGMTLRRVFREARGEGDVTVEGRAATPRGEQVG